MISAAWLKVVNRPFASSVTIAFLAAVARDDLGGVVEGGEPAVCVQRDDRIGGGLEQVAIARLRARQGLLRPPWLGDVAQGRHGPDQLAFDHERRRGHGDHPLVAVHAHDLRLVVLLRSLEGQPLVLLDERALAGGHEVVDGCSGQVLERPAEQVGRGTVGGDRPPIEPRDDHRVGERGHDFGRDALRIKRAMGRRLGRRHGRPQPARGRSAPALAHESYEATMASFIRSRLLSADSVTPRGASPRFTQPLMISSA